MPNISVSSWRLAFCVAISLAGAASCAGIGRLTVRASPHEQYGAMLQRSGIDQTALGQEWARAGAAALANAIPVPTPFQETGYFPPAEARAVGYRFDVARGRRLEVEVRFDSNSAGRLFVDLFEVVASEPPRPVATIEPGSVTLVYDVDLDSTLLLRIQPELLRGGRFTVTERTLASLRFPVPGLTSRAVQSLFGADRDAGAREHEGVDIFAAKGTAVVAVTSGVARASTNTLGGNVVWLRDASANRTFYYAHLDSQAVGGMAVVSTGDVIGYVGNTGNARTTAPHLHFGVYDGGAIDPLPFLQPDDMVPAAGSANVDRLGQLVRAEAGRTVIGRGPASPEPGKPMLDRGSVARVFGTTQKWLRVALPDGSVGYVADAAMTAAETPMRRLRLNAAAALREDPREASPVVESIEANTWVDVLGTFAGYQLLRAPSGATGWLPTRS